MIDEKIKRINQLSQKSKTTGLTEQEKIEQATLRKEYVAGFRSSLEQTLENTYIMDKQGNKTKVEKIK